jgi:hypothetical protein
LQTSIVKLSFHLLALFLLSVFYSFSLICIFPLLELHLQYCLCFIFSFVSHSFSVFRPLRGFSLTIIVCLSMPRCVSLGVYFYSLLFPFSGRFSFIQLK